MFQVKTTAGVAKPVLYDELVGQVTGLLTGESDWLANTANVAALIRPTPTIPRFSTRSPPNAAPALACRFGMK